MSTLDDAIAAHMAHGAGACTDPLTDCLFDQMQPSQPQRRFQVSITRPDGSADNWLRTGGNSCDHALEAAGAAGAGGVVRVVPLDQAGAA